MNPLADVRLDSHVISRKENFGAMLFQPGGLQGLFTSLAKVPCIQTQALEQSPLSRWHIDAVLIELVAGVCRVPAIALVRTGHRF
jgi:hypothetical protein